MKKLLMASSVAIASTMTGCNGCTMITKNLESDFSELDRDVVVINAFTNDTIFSYSGPCYFETSQHSNDVSLIYKVKGKARKADFVGGGFVFKAIER